MTIDEQAELKKVLLAMDGLIAQLMPQDDLVRLALDPKRRAAAAQMVGTTTLTRDLLHRALELCELMPNGLTANGRPKGNSKIDVWIRNHLPTSPVPKPEYVNRVVKAGFNRSNVYFALQRLLAEGTLKQTEGHGSQKRELFT